MSEVIFVNRGRKTPNLRKMFRALKRGPKRQSQLSKAMLGVKWNRGETECPFSYGNGTIQNHLQIGTIRRTEHPTFGVRYELTDFGVEYARQVLEID